MERKLVALKRRQTYRRVLGRRKRLQLGCVCPQTERLWFVWKPSNSNLSCKWTVLKVGSLEEERILKVLQSPEKVEFPGLDKYQLVGPLKKLQGFLNDILGDWRLFYCWLSAYIRI